MRRLNVSTLARAAITFVVSGAILLSGAAPAAASPSPLSCKSAGTLIGQPTFAGSCFMGYVEVNRWDNEAIPLVGGTPPYTVTLVSGYLPTGMALQRPGTVEGFPPLQQDSTFTVTVTDSSSPAQTLTTQVAIQTYGGTPNPTVEKTDNLLLPATQAIGPLLVPLHDGAQAPPPVASLIDYVTCSIGQAEWELAATTGLLGPVRGPKPVCQL